ncbi:MAG: mechanosensitive ion channel protein MscS [Bacteroidetes bacterium HGW-Bacteroidetes-17]|nr:MAG: mechanosensitive ion channel protein MscS [Bacteroidetes bacterium HGW-Bacteroidetes-17]
MEKMSKYSDYATDLLLKYGPQLLLALVTLIIGLWIINIFLRGFRKIILKGNFDPSLQPFLTSFLGIFLKILLIISVMGMVGIEMTSFIAVLGAAGLAVGMALSGSLQNFAGGVLILTFKPFKVGDYIEAQGHAGVVQLIHVFNTILTTPDNKTIIIPNGALSNASMVNYSTQTTRRVDLKFGTGYQDNIDKTKAVLKYIIESDKRILKDPEPVIAVSELADSSINFVVRPWVNVTDYWDVYFDLHEKVKKAFDNEGISIPYPQQDVHIITKK